MSAGRKIAVDTGDGVAPCWLHRPAAEGVYPGVVLYPDAGSVRHTMHLLADRLAGLGYVVLVPHIFYRSGDYAPFDTRTVFVDPGERDRLRAIIRALEMPAAMRDAARYIEALHDQPGVAAGRIGCTGYCIGGRLAFLTAGAHPDAVGAAASIHGGGVATDAADSPHLAAGRIQAELYFAVADKDPTCTPEQTGLLAAALAAAHVRFSIEHYAGVLHGFAVPDFVPYDRAAAERHWDRVADLVARALTPAER